MQCSKVSTIHRQIELHIGSHYFGNRGFEQALVKSSLKFSYLSTTFITGPKTVVEELHIEIKQSTQDGKAPFRLVVLDEMCKG